MVKNYIFHDNLSIMHSLNFVKQKIIGQHRNFQAKNYRAALQISSIKLWEAQRRISDCKDPWRPRSGAVAQK